MPTFLQEKFRSAFHRISTYKEGIVPFANPFFYPPPRILCGSHENVYVISDGEMNINFKTDESSEESGFTANVFYYYRLIDLRDNMAKWTILKIPHLLLGMHIM